VGRTLGGKKKEKYLHLFTLRKSSETSQGFVRICEDSRGFARIPEDSQGFPRIHEDSWGFLRIPEDSQEKTIEDREFSLRILRITNLAYFQKAVSPLSSLFSPLLLSLSPFEFNYQVYIIT